MELTRRQFVQVTGAAAAGVAFSGLGSDLTPVVAHAKELKTKAAKVEASKKGIMEAADLLIVNKADGSLLPSAKHTKADYSGAMQFIRRKYMHWAPKVLMISAATGFQLEQVEEAIQDFHKMMVDTNALHDKRATQAKQWMQSHFQCNLIAEMEAHPDIQKQIVDAFKSLETGATTPRAAADSLISSIKYEIRPN